MELSNGKGFLVGVGVGWVVVAGVQWAWLWRISFVDIEARSGGPVLRRKMLVILRIAMW